MKTDVEFINRIGYKHHPNKLYHWPRDTEKIAENGALMVQ
jgi:hypothetical protein